jgi:hypothetical protein
MTTTLPSMFSSIVFPPVRSETAPQAAIIPIVSSHIASSILLHWMYPS